MDAGEPVQVLADRHHVAADSPTATRRRPDREWNGAIGFAHSMFEMAADVMKRAKNPTDKASLRDAIIATNLNTIVGHVDWSKGPMKNVCKTPLVGGQWVKGDKWIATT